MPSALAKLLQETIDRELPALRNMPQASAASGWSPKEELGHLIDSAANNHMRFVVGALDGEFRGAGYAQDRWVDIHGYKDMPEAQLVDLWHGFNALLVRVVERIPEEQMKAQMFIGSATPVTLSFVIEDYVLHMQHHIDHLLGRDEITLYPRP